MKNCQILNNLRHYILILFMILVKLLMPARAEQPHNLGDEHVQYYNTSV